VDAGITAAARALDAGDCLTALKLVAARPDAPALALRGVAMARLGELGAARALLRHAARAFGDDPRARARCLVASAEIELADRDLARPADLTEAVQALSAAGDARNAAWARLVLARRAILLGRLDEAEGWLAAVPGGGGDAPPVIAAVRALADLEVALRRLDATRARAAVERAEALGRTTRLPALEAEIAAAREALDRVVARARTREGAREIRLEDLAALAGEGALVVDACRRRVARGSVARDLRKRPAVLALLRALAATHPDGVPRDVLAATLFGARRPDASYRSRLRVEVGRARVLVRGLAGVVATADGYRLETPARVVVLEPPDDAEGADVLALVESGGAWTAASLAAALGCGVRRVQRALKALDEAGRVRGIGRGPSRRWAAAPRIASHLLLPGLLLVR
jgi:hypothetical protein